MALYWLSLKRKRMERLAARLREYEGKKSVNACIKFWIRLNISEVKGLIRSEFM